MFKRLETAWNARTPVYLHNGTKENVLFQLMLVACFLLGMFGADKVKERAAARRRRKALYS